MRRLLTPQIFLPIAGAVFLSIALAQLMLSHRQSVNIIRARSDLNMFRLNEALKNCSCVKHFLHGPGNVTSRITPVVLPTAENNTSFNIDTRNADKANAIGRDVKAGKYIVEPIDQHNYTYIHNPSKTCFHENGERSGIYLLFFVPTAPKNFDRREAVRRSFGNELNWPTIDTARSKAVFLIGKTDDDGIQEAIDREAIAHRDIVQEDFVDSYLNLTRKTVMGMKWATLYCRHARFVIKIDDDTTVNQSRIIDIVTSAPRANFITGFVFKDPPVDRNRKSKFFLSNEYFPGPKFPPYAAGNAYIMSSDLVESLYHVALTQRHFPFEDVFVGICLEKMGVKLTHDPKFIYLGLSKDMMNPFTAKKISGFTIFRDLPKDFVWKIFDKCRINPTN